MQDRYTGGSKKVSDSNLVRSMQIFSTKQIIIVFIMMFIRFRSSKARGADLIVLRTVVFTVHVQTIL